MDSRETFRKKVFNKVLDTFEINEEVYTPFGRGRVYLQNSNYVSVALSLRSPIQSFAFDVSIPVILTFERWEIKRIEDDKEKKDSGKI